jgi:hypothetical protein
VAELNTKATRAKPVMWDSSGSATFIAPRCKKLIDQSVKRLRTLVRDKGRN